MTSFADSATSFISERPDAVERRSAWERFEILGLPTTSDEVWRYAPLRDLNIDQFSVASLPRHDVDSPFAAQLCERAGLVVRVTDGFGLSVSGLPDGVSVEFVEAAPSLHDERWTERYAGDSFALLNVALAPSTTVIRISAGHRGP